MRIMAAALVILLAGILVLAWQLRSEMNTDRRLTREIDDLHSKLADKSGHENFERQRDCTSQAEKVFHQVGWKENEQTNGTLAAYESHYNIKTGKCFILFHLSTYSTSLSMQSTILTDAYDRRDYAELNITHPLAGADHIATCSLMPPDGDERRCESKAEFTSFLMQYLEAVPQVP